MTRLSTPAPPCPPKKNGALMKNGTALALKYVRIHFRIQGQCRSLTLQNAQQFAHGFLPKTRIKHPKPNSN
jgi:hypothetical protein